MPQGYQPSNVGSSDSHPQYQPGGHSYNVGDIFTYTDGGETKAYIVQTAFVSTNFMGDTANFTEIAGGGATYTGTATVTVGGVTAGDSFAAQDLQEMMQAILEPFQAPTFSAFNIQGFNILEVGASIPSGNQTFTWSTTQSGNVAPNSIEILDLTGGSIVLGTGLANDGSEVLSLPSAITKTTNTSHTFRITGDDTQAGSFQRDDTVNWQWRRFYGKDASAGPLNETQVEALPNSSLAGGYSGTYVFPAGAGYVYFAFPQAWGTASTFKDTATNLDVAMEAPYDVNLTNGNGITETYRIHRSTNVLNGAITIAVS